jgi:cyclopropane-fatty-acyl-phospholipid synthase|tara:strand:+ start:466 stop:1152 length:687 start_codon:yes stop_codon:yes gene_type:complete
LRELLLNRSLGALAEAHLKGDVDGQCAPEVFFELVDYLQERKWTLKERLTLLLLAVGIAKRPRDASNVFQSWAARTHNGRESISHHYDVSNAFYRLFLDPEMVYSCAYFSDPGQTLDAAQQDKLDYLCRKLRLQPGQSLLDIGCDWGGLAFWAASHYGARVHGITLSQQQFDYATARAIELGLEDKVRFELRDYRQLSDAQLYDRIVSVGMFEHIGIRNFPDYFSTGV